MTRNALEWFIALRFLFSLKGQRFLAVLTVLGLLLVIGTVALTYSIICIAESFSTDLRNKLLVARPHVEVLLAHEIDTGVLGRLRADPGVHIATPVIVGSALLEGTDAQEGVQVWGIEDAAFFNDWQCAALKRTAVHEHVGSADADITLGTALFDEFYLHIPATLTLSLIYPLGDVDPFGNSTPTLQHFSVAKTCESGVYPIDRKVVVVSPDAARDLFAHYRPAWTHLWVLLRDPFATDDFLSHWRGPLSELGQVSTWKENNKMLLGALSLERKLVAGIILLVFALASMTLYGMLTVLTLEKQADFAVFYTLGLSERSFFAILIRMAALLAIGGALLGGIVGMGAVAYLSRFALPLPEAYYVESLLVSQQWGYLVGIMAASALVQVVAALIPGLWLERIRPVEALRFVEGGVV